VKRPQSPVSRAHDKLGLALVHFALGAAARDKRALDVTASTPGYAALLLERGATQVSALDVGPSPLSPKLRADPRVAFVERANMKLLPASSLPGPFDFFTVDLRFAAARTVLRAIAFRLAPVANGVVWLKPRFEVPAEQVRGGGLVGAALREHALGLFCEKAVALGFELAGQVESPGEDGDELMLHLVYRRPATTAPRRPPAR